MYLYIHTYLHIYIYRYFTTIISGALTYKVVPRLLSPTSLTNTVAKASQAYKRIGGFWTLSCDTGTHLTGAGDGREGRTGTGRPGKVDLRSTTAKPPVVKTIAICAAAAASSSL